MNLARVRTQLAKKYPHATIKERIDPITKDVIEVICEVDRGIFDSNRDVAVVVADRSQEHFHKATTEEYKVLKGNLSVFLNGKPTELSRGDTLIIKPGVEHRVESNETWLLCFSEPDWTPDDYRLV